MYSWLLGCVLKIQASWIKFVVVGGYYWCTLHFEMKRNSVRSGVNAHNNKIGAAVTARFLCEREKQTQCYHQFKKKLLLWMNSLWREREEGRRKSVCFHYKSPPTLLSLCVWLVLFLSHSFLLSFPASILRQFWSMLCAL